MRLFGILIGLIVWGVVKYAVCHIHRDKPCKVKKNENVKQKYNATCEKQPRVQHLAQKDEADNQEDEVSEQKSKTALEAGNSEQKANKRLPVITIRSL